MQPPTACTLRYLTITPSRIHLLRFLVEAYEGMAVVSTLDARSGLVALSIAPGCEEDVELLVRSLAWGNVVRPV